MVPSGVGCVAVIGLWILMGIMKEPHTYIPCLGSLALSNKSWDWDQLLNMRNGVGFGWQMGLLYLNW